VRGGKSGPGGRGPGMPGPYSGVGGAFLHGAIPTAGPAGDVPRLGYIPRNGVELPFHGGYVFVPIDNVACAGERFV